MEIDFKKMDGLVPVVVQDNQNGELLMVGFANADAYAMTLASGYVTFFSRTRQKLWLKGETSGNRLRVISAATDCDNDCLLFRVEVEGDGLGRAVDRQVAEQLSLQIARLGRGRPAQLQLGRRELRIRVLARLERAALDELVPLGPV